MHELPLVFFTLFAQMAAGLTLILGIYSFVQPQEVIDVNIKIANIVAIALMISAMLVATLHLGRPWRAFNVIFGIRHSPLSHEIMAFSFLLGILILSILYLQLVKRPNKIMVHLLALGMILFSLLLIGSICRVYQLDSIRSWHTHFVTLQMVISMLILGGILTLLLGIQSFGLFFFVSGIVFALIYKLPYSHFIERISLTLYQTCYHWWLAEMILLIGATLAILIALFSQQRLIWYGLTLLLAFASQTAGRIAFYNSWLILS